MRQILVSLLVASANIAPVVVQQPRPASTAAPAAQPAPALPLAQALVLIRTSLIAAQQANETGDYDVLYRLGTASFQAGNPPQKLAQAFAPTRAWNIASVAVLEPQFTELPHVGADKTLVMAGFFVNDGYRIDFRLAYAPETGRWRMAGIALGVRPLAKNVPPSR